MEQFFKYVLGEIRVIADAPVIFGAGLLALAGAIWWAIDWRHGGIIGNRDSEIASLKTQRDDYRDKFANLKISGAKDAPANGVHAVRIIEFIRMGERIDTEFIVSNDAQYIKAAYAEWSQNTEQYLGDSLGSQYAIRFRNAVPYPFVSAGMSIEGVGAWQNMKGRISVLIAFLSEISR